MKNYCIKPFLFFMTCLIFFVATGQKNMAIDSLKERYRNETLHLFQGYIAKGENDERIRGTDLKNEFSMSPEGFKEFTLAQANRKTAIILAGSALSLIIAGGIIHNGNNKDLGIGLMIGGAALNLISIPFSISSTKKLHHAIWLRNRDILFPLK